MIAAVNGYLEEAKMILADPRLKSVPSAVVSAARRSRKTEQAQIGASRTLPRSEEEVRHSHVSFFLVFQLLTLSC